MKVSEQSEIWMQRLGTRTRRPVKTSTLVTYRAILKCWVVPALGGLELDQVTNRVIKELVAQMRARRKSPVTVQMTVHVVRDIIRSDRDPETGEQRVKLAFDPDFVDLPLIDKRKQKAPTTTGEAISQAISGAQAEGSQYAMLYAILGATGLRISEARAIRVGKMERVTYWDPEQRLIRVLTQMSTDGDISPKSTNSDRIVDLPHAVNDYLLGQCVVLKRYHKDRLFEGCEDYARNDLAKRAIPGFHAFRRFRATHLRMMRAPEDLIRFWLGHSSQQITDRYSKLSERVDVRREWVEKVGLGFELPQREDSK